MALNAARLAALLQLASPSLPVGAYSYSQGLEAAVEQGYVRSAEEVERWIGDALALVLGRLEAPLWLRLHRACVAGDWTMFRHWNEEWVATRETAELRAETLQMGYSAVELLRALGHEPPFDGAQIGLPAALAWACACWHIDESDGLVAYLFSWAENQVTAAIKCVPLGQVAGQRILLRLHQRVATAVDVARGLADEAMRSQSPALAILSSQHEAQYSRLFRS